MRRRTLPRVDTAMLTVRPAMRLLLVVVAALAACGEGVPDADTDTAPGREATAPPRRPRAVRVEPRPDVPPEVAAALGRAEDLADHGRLLDALAELAPLRAAPQNVATAHGLAGAAAAIADWEEEVVATFEGDAGVDAPLNPSSLAHALDGVLDPGRRARLRALASRPGLRDVVPEERALTACTGDEQRAALRRTLVRFGTLGERLAADDRPRRTPLDDALDRAASGSRRQATPLPVVDSGGLQRRREELLLGAARSGTVDLLEAASAGLAWIAAHQRPDGSLHDVGQVCALLGHGERPCGGVADGRDPVPDRPVATTALAVLAFEAFRDVDARGRFETAFAAAAAALDRMRLDDGGFPRHGYDAGLGILALARAARSSGDPTLRDAALAAWSHHAAAIGPDGGFRYVAGRPGDLSVTGWFVRAHDELVALGALPEGDPVRGRMRVFTDGLRRPEGAFAYRGGGEARPSLAGHGADVARRLGIDLGGAPGERRPAEDDLYSLHGVLRAAGNSRGEDVELLRALVTELQVPHGAGTGSFRAGELRWLPRGGAAALTPFATWTLLLAAR